MIDKNTKLGAAIEAVTPITQNQTKKTKGLSKITSKDKKTLTILTEIVIIAFIGSLLGAYFNASSIQRDCSRLGVAKVGDAYINCTVVVQVNNAPTVTPQ